MQQKYTYAYNGVFNWIRGLIPSVTRGAQQEVFTYSAATSKTLVWRNHVTENYKVSENYTQQPLDLSNFLFIRTRENLLLQNKLHNSLRVLRSGKTNALNGPVIQKSLTNVVEDIKTSVPLLQNMIWVLQPANGAKTPDLPVAFATNTLYVLERNGASARDAYENLLLPIIRAKAENFHAEGVAQAIWALANAELVEDKALWSTLSQLAQSKDFTPLIIKNGRWTTAAFYTHGGAEHFFQSELSEFAD